MSDDRAHETADRLEPEASPNVPEPAAAVRRAHSAETHGSPTAGKDHPTRARGAIETKTAAPARLIRFLREVVSELSKVIWPSRRELVVYTGVVLVFVSFMVAFVALLDMGLGRAVLTVFG